jgi:23S rRNA (uracil1939-C5)-methyltransferase
MSYHAFYAISPFFPDKIRCWFRGKMAFHTRFKNQKKLMNIKKGRELEVTISDIAFGGRGFTRVEGFSIFVDQAVALDRVRVRIVKKKKNYAEARVLELLEPSPYRIDPPCAYSGICGGCKWQFLDYEKQLYYKTRQVADSLAHIGLLTDVPVQPAWPSEAIFGYRNKMEFSCSDQRWLMPEEMADETVIRGFGIGLHVPGTYHKVLDIERCHIQPETGNAILADVRRFIGDSGVPVYGLRSHEGFWRFLMLRHSAAFDQWMVNIVTAQAAREVVQPLADQLMATYPSIVSVVNNITARKAGVAIGESEILLAGQPCIYDKLGPYKFEISANSFFQTNTRGAEKLYGKVREYAQLTGSETVVDLYSGTGTIPIWLSDAAREIIGIEIVESAVADARRNCEKNGITNCRFMTGDIRDGMHKDVVQQVLALAPQRMVYVSCNPATLARDLGLLKEQYDIREVQPVDMFPHTWHIESVALLTAKHQALHKGESV